MSLFNPNPPREPKDRLIFALDVDNIDEAERLVKALAPHVGAFKVGCHLFTNAGPLVLDLVHGMGGELFLDLKFHDIPATVAAAVRQAARRRVKMLTVHALGGAAMIEAIGEEYGEMTLIPGSMPPLVLAVTILTSQTEAQLAAIGFDRPLSELTVHLAQMSIEAGASGVVASGHELAQLKPKLPEGVVFVCPGIRGPGDPVGDQARVMTAKEAVEAGATYVVVGRPIRQADDPVDAAQRFVDDIAQAQG